MKVLVSDPLAQEAVQKLEDALGKDQVTVKTDMTPEELKRTIVNYEAIIVRSATKVTREIIENASKLKIIARGGIGLDNIDLEAAKERNVMVLNTPTASSISVAELAIAHMFAACRFLQRADSGLKSCKWEKKKLKGREIFGKTIGIIGLGNIGKEVAKRAVALGMKVIGYDPVAVPKGLDVQMVSLDELYSKADIITLHVPKTESTTNLLDKEAFSKMKDGVIIVNCSRGGVVNEDALYNALVEGKIYHAASDVFASEPPGEHPLLKLPNFTATPHIGASTTEGQFRVGMEVVEKVINNL